MVDFVEISNVCARKGIIEAAKRIINSDEVRRSYEFWRHFFGTQCTYIKSIYTAQKNKRVTMRRGLSYKQVQTNAFSVSA